MLLIKQTQFIVMGNVFCSEYQIHKRFDLKGSSHGQSTDKPREQIDETTTLKDLDLNFVFRLEQSWFQELIWYWFSQAPHSFIFWVLILCFLTCLGFMYKKILLD